MPFHIIITSRTPQHDNIRLDLSEQELGDRYIRPYNEGGSLFIGGRIVTPDNIDRIRITYTEEESNTIYPIVEQELENQRRSRNLVVTTPPEYFIAIRGRDVTDQFVTGPPRTISEREEVTQVQNPRDVWVVHGRNLQARDAMFEFLRSLDLHPVEWEEATTRTDETSPYIGQVLDIAFEQAQAFVILLSGDDEGRLLEVFQRLGDPPFETALTPQARQNVIFEAGMAFGRSPRKTILVEMGELRPFSNIFGRHVIRMNNSSQRRQQLAQRLESAGCPVNMSGTDWHTAGDFRF